ncbi:MAG: hypothetical protein VB111_03225 [Clostridiaceae bacterium]|nr:hypothetical protein [Clostridiaceae bacterium]
MIWILLGFTLIALIDMIPIIRKRSGRTLFVFLLFFLSALTLAVLQTMNIEVPSVFLFLGRVLKGIGISY